MVKKHLDWLVQPQFISWRFYGGVRQTNALSLLNKFRSFPLRSSYRIAFNNLRYWRRFQKFKILWISSKIAINVSPATSARVHSREHLSRYKRYSIDYKVATEPVNRRKINQSYFMTTC